MNEINGVALKSISIEIAEHLAYLVNILLAGAGMRCGAATPFRKKMLFVFTNNHYAYKINTIQYVKILLLVVYVITIGIV